MKKSITMLAAFALAASAALAQGFNPLTANVKMDRDHNKPLTINTKTNAQKAPSRINLDSDERLVGWYTGDEYPAGEGIGLTSYTGTYDVGTIYPASNLGPCVGATVTKMRFALATACTVNSVALFKVSGSTVTEVSRTALTNTSCPAGWTDVTLETPVTIEAGYDYLMAYNYVQTSNGYPLGYDRDYVSVHSTQGIQIYGNLGQGTGWYSAGTSYGDILVQMVVKGANYADEDIAVSNLACAPYGQKGGMLPFTFSVQNTGNNIPTSYTLQALVDGELVATIATPVELTNVPQTLTGNVELPAELDNSIAHTLTIKVLDINGNAPAEETTADDETSTDFNTYTQAYPRQKQLVEHFTSQYCPYCPLGYDVLRSLVNKRDDVAWVGIHGDMSAGTDVYTVAEAQNIMAFQTQSFPSASFNRFYNAGYNEETLALPLGYRSEYKDLAADMFSEFFDLSNEYNPAFVNVAVETSFDNDTREATVRVTGNVAEDAFEAVQDAVVTVYITEDGLKARQLNQGTWVSSYEHENVLRAVLCDNQYSLGDVPEFTDGKYYEKNYTTTIPAGWNADNLWIVAIVSRPINVSGNSFATEINDAFVWNCERVKLGDNYYTGVDTIDSDPNAVPVAYFTIDGRAISTPAQGVNIVKMSDGTTRKVLVK